MSTADTRAQGHGAAGAAPGYGIDAPYVPAGLATAGLALAAAAVAAGASGGPAQAVAVPAVAAVWFAALAGIYVHTTLRGKLACWRDEIARLGLRGDETVLDVGCGRGAVLVIAGSAVPRGRVVGADLWRRHDQSGNGVEATRANLARAGVTAAVDLRTADMTDLPLDESSVDLVVSNAAVHNVDSRSGRDRAVTEMVRVLRPGGRVMVADFLHAGEYAGQLRALGMDGVTTRSLGWRGWYSGPWLATRMVTATKPARATGADEARAGGPGR